MNSISCSEYAFPSLELPKRLELVRLLGFDHVDVGLFPESDAEIRALGDDPVGAARELASQVASSGLEVADVFLILGGGAFAANAINAADDGRRNIARRAFAAAVEAATAVGAPGVTVLPGTPWPWNREEGWHRCADELRWRVDTAAAAGLELRIEAHLGSIVSTPELARELLDAVPGLRLTLDASHFVTQSIGMDRIRPLAASAGHVHVRGAKPGIIQTAWKRNETDFDALLRELGETRYAGAICVEYVPMEQWQCDEMDVLTSVLETKSSFEALLARALEAVRS